MTIKKNRVKVLSEIGNAPLTFDNLWDDLPESVKYRCTENELALLIDAMRKQFVLGVDQGYKDATTY